MSIEKNTSVENAEVFPFNNDDIEKSNISGKNRLIDALKLVTAISLSAVYGCASQQKCDSTMQEVQSQNDSADDEVDVHDNGWTAFEKKYNLSDAESAILEPVFNEYGEKVLPYMRFILSNENRSLSLIAAFAENPVTEGSYLRLEEIILTHEHLNAEVYAVMGPQMKYESSRLLLIGAMQSGNFKDDIFVREYARTNSYYGYDFETLVAIFKSSQFSERIFDSLANIRGFSIFPPTFYNRAHTDRIKKYAYNLALKDPNALYDFEDAVLALSKANGRNNPTTIQNNPYYELLRLFDANGSDDEFSFNNIAVKAEVAKVAVIVNEPKDHEKILEVLKPALDSAYAEELKRELIENIRDDNYIKLLGAVAKNSEFDMDAIKGLKDAAAECGQYTYVLADYLEHQDLEKWKDAFKLVIKYAKHAKAVKILEILSGYFTSSSYCAKRFEYIVQNVEKNDRLKPEDNHTEQEQYLNLVMSPQFNDKYIDAMEIAFKRARRNGELHKKRSVIFNGFSSFLESGGWGWLIEWGMQENGDKYDYILSYLNSMFWRSKSGELDFSNTNFEKGRELASKLGIKKPDVVVSLNFAWAIKELGEAKTSTLYQQNGIRYFTRYSKEILEYQLEKPPTNKPPLLIAYMIADHNGAGSHPSFLNQLYEHFDTTIIETGNEKDIFARMSAMNGGVSIISAHGYPSGFTLGPGYSETAIIDGNDIRDIRKIPTPPKLIILLSCSTGKNDRSIGAKIAKAVGAKVFAPTEDTALESIELTDGKITDIKFVEGQTSVFDYTQTANP